MKTNWHRYNLKRRISGLPPVPANEFAEKLQILEKERLENQVDEFGFPILKPIQNIHGPYKRSHRHGKPMAIRRDSSASGVSTIGRRNSLVRVASEAESILSQATTDSLKQNGVFGEDTASEYGFTSDSNYEYEFTDEDIIEEDEEDTDGQLSTNPSPPAVTCCMYCGVDNKELERNVRHMFRRHGLYIPERSYLVDLPGLLTFLNNLIIRNYSCLCCNFVGGSLESIRAHMESKRHCRMPYETDEERKVFAKFYDFSPLTGVSNEELEPTFVTPSEDNNNSVNDVSLDETGLELTLPTGVRLGHRAGRIYYRQNLPPQSSNSEPSHAVTTMDRRLMGGITEKQFKKGLSNMHQLENRALNNNIKKTMKRANFHAHFRDEISI